MESSKIFTTTVPVLINHINYGGHLGYDSLLSIIQEARIKWLKSVNKDSSELNIQDGVGWMVKEVHVNYEAEAFHGDVLEVAISISDASRSSLTLSYEVTNVASSAVVCTASTPLIFFNFAKSKVARIPEVLKNCAT